MRVGVYAHALKMAELTGIGCYLYQLLTALAQIDQTHTYSLLSNAPLAHMPLGETMRSIVVKQRGIKKGFSYLGFPQMLREGKYDVAFIPSEFIPFNMRLPVVITTYDLYYLQLPDALKREVGWQPKLHFQIAKRRIAKAAKILSISENTKKELITLCGISPEKIVVTPLGCDPMCFHTLGNPEEVFKKYQIHPPYFINMSSVWWGRKNLVRLLQAFAMMKKRTHLPHQLIITGKPGPSLPAMQEVIRKEKLEDHVRLLNYLAKPKLFLLLKHAAACVFPSLHEGFGLPVVDAMAMGCPVVTSNTSALKEIAEGAALLVDPFSVDALSAGMEKVCEEQVRKNLIAQGYERSRLFSWSKAAEKTLHVINEVNIL